MVWAILPKMKPVPESDLQLGTLPCAAPSRPLVYLKLGETSYNVAEENRAIAKKITSHLPL
jgi:hypothetical protein